MMKLQKFLAVLLACLLLCGCAAREEPETTSQLQPTGTSAAVQEPVPTVTFSQVGSTRVDHTINISSVRYVTAASQLPANEALAAYDDEYFETGALLLIYETVTNSGIAVGIDSILVSDGVASVTLTHDNQGGVSTPVMTTYLIWAETEQGLDLKWQVENPAVESEVSNS